MLPDVSASAGAESRSPWAAGRPRTRGVIWKLTFGMAAMGGLALGMIANRPTTASANDGDAPRSVGRAYGGGAAAVIVKDVPLAHTAQILPIDPQGQLAAGGPAAQVAQVLKGLDQALQAVGSKLGRSVKLNWYVTSAEVVPEIQGALERAFPADQRPAVSFVETPLPLAGAVAAADAVATVADDPGRAVKLGLPEPREAAERSASASSSTGGHCIAAVVPSGSRIYIAGQAEASENLAEATQKTMQSLRDTLIFLGRSDRDVVQLKAFLQPMAEAATVRQAIAEFYGDRPTPPLTLVEWKSSARVPIEIELIAWGGVNQAGDAVEFLTPPQMSRSPIFSRVARIHHTASIYISGLYATSPEQQGDGKSAGEARRTLEQLGEVLQATGSDFQHLVKATYYVADDTTSAELNQARPDFYDPERPPSASKAMVAGVARPGLAMAIDMIAVPAAATPGEYGAAETGHGLQSEEAAAGWISLFDGKTTFGWQGARLDDGRLAGGATTTRFGPCELRAIFARGGRLTIGGKVVEVSAGEFHLAETSRPGDRAAAIALGDDIRVTQLMVRPLNLKPLFDGRQLSPWQPIQRPNTPEDRQARWTVEGQAIQAQGGPGCIEYQGQRWGDFVLQVDVQTHRRHANGGIFIRSIPGDFMNGYEIQVFNRAEQGDPSRPAVWSTGAIDDRQNARRLASRDRTPFRITVIAQGAHIATWVNGFQQTDWTDERAPDANPRRGRRGEPGALQLQAHDAGTRLEYRAVAALAWE